MPVTLRNSLAAILSIAYIVLSAIYVGKALSGEVKVTLKAWKFNPQTITVSVGDAVTWVHEDDEYDTHNVLFEDPAIKGFNKRMKSGHKFSFTFDKPGEYPYYCSYHKDNGMIGVVVVNHK